MRLPQENTILNTINTMKHITMKQCTLALLCAAAATTALGQSGLAFNRSLTLAPADAASSGGGGAGVDDEKAKAAALAKATLNPIASLISLPLQNNFDWGGRPNDDGFQ